MGPDRNCRAGETAVSVLEIKDTTTRDTEKWSAWEYCGRRNKLCISMSKIWSQKQDWGRAMRVSWMENESNVRVLKVCALNTSHQNGDWNQRWHRLLQGILDTWWDRDGEWCDARGCEREERVWESQNKKTVHANERKPHCGTIYRSQAGISTKFKSTLKTHLFRIEFKTLVC